MYVLCYIICFSTISKILNKTEWFILCWDMLIDAAGKGWIPSQWRIFLQPKPAPITLSDAEAWLNSFIRKAAWDSSPPHHHTMEQIRGKLWRAVHSLTSGAGAWLVAAVRVCWRSEHPCVSASTSTVVAGGGTAGTKAPEQQLHRDCFLQPMFVSASWDGLSGYFV